MDMTIEQLRALVVEQWQDYQQKKEVSDKAAHVWCDSYYELGRREKEVEIERLVTERLAGKAAQP